MSWGDWKIMVRVFADHGAARLKQSFPPHGYVGHLVRILLEEEPLEMEGARLEDADPQADPLTTEPATERPAHYSGGRVDAPPADPDGGTRSAREPIDAAAALDPPPATSPVPHPQDHSASEPLTSGLAWNEGAGSAGPRGSATSDPLAGTDEAIGAPEFAPDDVIADTFQVTRILGRTRRYTSYLTHHRSWNVDVVVKIARAEALADPPMRSAIEAAARRWTSLGFYPHIAYCHHVQEVDGMPMIAIEYVEGGSLRQWLSDGQVSDRRAALNLGIQICHAIDHAHAQQFWHGALTPENVLLTPEGMACVTDLGIAGLHAREGFGVEAYVAPERWAGAGVDAQTDIFALGVCLYELLCGTRPYGSTRESQQGPAEPHGSGGEDRLPDPLVRALKQCVAWEPQRRPQTVAEIRHILCEAHVTLFGQPSPFASLPEVSWDSDGWNNQAVAALLGGSAPAAEAAWANALAADPGHLETIYNYGIVRWRRGELSDQALIAQLERTKAPQGRQWLAPYLRGLVQLERGDAEAALTLLEKAQAQSPRETAVQEALVLARSHAKANPQANRECTGHASFVSAVCITPDGRGVLSAGDDNVVCLWDAARGEVLRTFEGHTRRVLSVCVAPDGVTALSGADDRTLRVWDLRTGECLRTLATTGTVFGVSLGANGLAVSTSGGTDSIVDLRGTLVQLWDVTKGRCLRTLEGHGSAVKAVALSADGRSVLTGGDDQTVRLWDVATGACGRVFTGHQHYISRVVLSIDGTRALSASWDGTLRLWDTSKGRCIRVFKGHEGIVTSVGLSDERRLVISGGLDNSVRLWDLDSGRCLRTFDGHSGLVTGVALSPDGRIAASASWDQTVRVWTIPDLRHGYCSPRLSTRTVVTEVTPVEPGPDELLTDAEAALQRQEWAVALSGMRRARERLGDTRSPRAVRLWRALSRVCTRVQLREARLVSTIAAADRVDAVRLNPDGQWVFTAGRDKSMRVCNTEQGRWTHTLEGHSDGVLDLCVSANGGLALSASADHTLRQWDLTTGACVRVLAGHTSVVTAVCMSADQKWAFSGSYDHTLRLWDLATGDCRRVFKGQQRQVTAVCLSPDERWVLTGGQDGTLHLWDRVTATSVRTFTGHTGRVTALAVSSDGQWLLSGSADRTLRLWQLSSGECTGCFAGHADMVLWVALAPGGRWAFSAGRDGSIVLWDLLNGSGAPALPAAAAGLTAAALSPDGDWLAVAGRDNQLRRWELEWELEVTAAERETLAALDDERLRETS